MKLAFARQSKPSTSKSKPSFSDDRPTTANQPEYLSEFDASKTLTSSQNRSAIIPPKQNEWRPHKKMRNLDLPPLQSSNSLEFEIAPELIAAKDDSMSYGLNLRQNDGGGKGNGKESYEEVAIRQLRSELDTLPAAQDVEEYEDMPVEGFAEALLKGYGWKEGRGIGRNAREDVKPVEYKRRTAKEGLGFMADHPPAKAEEKNGKRREREREKASVKVGVGKEVRVVSGEEFGVKGRVLEVLEGGFVVLREEKRGKEMKVRADDVAEIGSVEEEQCLRKLMELRIQEGKKGDDHHKSDRRERSKEKRCRERGRERSSGRVEITEEREERRKSDGVLWLRSHIRVRIVSKELKGGRLFLKKGKVVDVIGPGVCDLTMDEGREMVQGVDQRMLETALPRRGGPVVVLFGKHKGVYGSLVEKDSGRETGIVQDADSQEMIRVQLDQIAEYTGDPSELGY